MGRGGKVSVLMGVLEENDNPSVPQRAKDRQR